MKKPLRIILIIFCIILVGVSGYLFYKDLTYKDKIYEPALNDIKVDDSEKTPVAIEHEVIKMSPDVDLAAQRLYYNNNDIIGRLEIPDLFNILVVNGIDNKYYLNKDLYKKSNVKGNEFLDYRLKPDAKQVNIYGHNSRDPNVQVPFLRLEKYIDKDFFDNNPYIIWQYDGGKRIYKISVWKEIQTDREHMIVDTSGATFLGHVSKLLSNSTYIRSVPYDVNSNIIILQTCSHHLSNAFYLLIGIEIQP